MNVNLKVPGMNPVNPAQDMNMIWMSAPTSIEGFYQAQQQLPSLDELTQQSALMENPIQTDFHPGGPGGLPGLPINPMEFFNLQQLQQLQQQQQQIDLQNYAAACGLNVGTINSTMIKVDEDEIGGDPDEETEEEQQQYTGNYQYIENSDQENAIMNEDYNSSNSSSGNFMLSQQQQMFNMLNKNVAAGQSMEGSQSVGQNFQNYGQRSKESFKKIKPVKRPGLVLKTPIAYQGDIDPSVIPIQRDGMAVCEKCGAIGVKHSFYTKQRRFCSMTCARGFELSGSSSSSSNIHQASTSNDKSNMDDKSSLSKNIQQQQQQQVQNTFRFKFSNGNNNGTIGSDNESYHQNQSENGSPASSVLYRDILPQEDLPQIPKVNRLPSPCPQDDKIQTIRRRPNEFPNTYDWTPQLSNPDFYAAPVTCFRHAPGYDMWPNIVTGMKVEVENTDSDQTFLIGNTPHSFWVATVLKIHGYKALLRYEGFDDDASHDFWVNLCSAEVHPVGWCATKGKPLIPPRSIENKYSDWKEFLVSHLSGARTLPSTFYNKINDSLRSRFRTGLLLEVVDKMRISQMKVATVCKIVGKRLFVRYWDSGPEDGFWCHEDSSLIHHVSWASSVGHPLDAPPDYIERMNDEIFQPLENDSTVDLFKTNFSFEDYYLDEQPTRFVKGMKLEAIDPLNLSSICVATVMDVLNFGYIMIRIDSYEPDATGADWFCYHEKSPNIFPAGFCGRNGINLTPPKGYDSESFSWDQYLIDTASIAAPEDIFPNERVRHRFKVGMKVECADLMDPRLVCVASISRVVGNLLKIHFDGWEDEYDQWLHCTSSDIYPVGWAFLVSHKLEGPRILPKLPPKISPKLTRKKRGRKKGVKNSEDQKAAPFTRTAQIKKEQEEFEHQKQQTKSIKRSSNQLSVKVEPKIEPFEQQEGTSNQMEEDDDDYDSSMNHSFDASTTSQKDDLTEHDFTGVVGGSDQQQELSSSTSAQTTTTTTPIPTLKHIPKLNRSSNCNSPEKLDPNQILPDTWNNEDVVQFLKINDCAAHSESFVTTCVDGKRMLELTKDDIIGMLGMKVGPALKIYDLIQQLKCRINPKLLKGNLIKKFL
uniref:CSON013286 protein n=1 Tax=Culicoides sonorensis TaxID=179676 RepID=A0A336KNL0_CULSO